MFPAEALPPAVLKAWRAVLPKSTLIFPVGGIGPGNLAPYWAAGASGFGTGSGLYRPGQDAATVATAAAALAAACRALAPRGADARP
jgi:2-dehydro-3-deoxyphosphogalactonate aldolase